jgi:hypothetical protein
MALEDLLDIAQEQIGSESSSAPGLPSYLVGSSNHQVASGWSLMAPSTWAEGAEDLGKFTLTAGARAIASTINIVPEAVNWAGGTMDTIDTYSMISKLDNNLADYYAMNQGNVDLVGDIAASFVPGMAGVKVLNYGQKALKTMSAGKSGFNLAAHIGALPDAASSIGMAAGKQMAAQSQAFTMLNSNVLKSVAAGYGQYALESAAFMGAGQVAMGWSPVFEKQDASDIFWNSLWGGGVGAGIMGSLAAARTYGAVKSGMKAADAALNPATLFTASAGTSPTTRLTLALHDINHPPVFKAAAEDSAEITAALQASFGKKLTARQMELDNIITAETQKLVKDPQLAALFAQSMRTSPYETVIGNIEHMANIERVGTGAKTPIEKLFAKVTGGFGKPGEVAPNLAVQYVKLTGERAMQVSPDAPTILNIADTVKNADAVHTFVAKQKFKAGDNFAPSLANDHMQAEARYIWASKLKEMPEKIAPRDIALLEESYARNKAVTLSTGETYAGPDLLTYIKTAKTKEAYLLREAYPEMSIEEVAKRINVKQSLLEGEVKTTDELSDYFGQNYRLKEWENPTYAKIAYDTKPMLDTNGHVMDAVAHAKANQKEFRNAVEMAIANETGLVRDAISEMPARIGDRPIVEANRIGAGGGFASIMNENYGTIGSIVQQIGSVVNRYKTKITGAIDDSFTPLAHKVLVNQAASDDIVKAYNMVLGSAEKYVLADDGVLRMKKVNDAMREGKGTWPALLDKNSPIELPIKSQEARDFLKQWISHNDSQLTSSESRIAYQLGTPTQDLKGSLYIPPPDPKNYPNFAFVVDNSITGTGHVRMIHAADPQKLELLAEQVSTRTGLKVVFKGQSESFHKAMQDYEYGLGINENYINTAMARTGVSAPYFAVTDARKIVNEMMDWRKRSDINNFREWVRLKYAPEFEALNQLATGYDNVAGSVKGYAGKYSADAVKNPYNDLVKTALDVSRKEEYPIWTPLNRLLENGASKLVAKLHDSVATAPAGTELDRVSAMLKESGISANFTDAATMMLANHSAPRPVLEEFVRKANGALSFLMLRSDPLNAMNNGFGHTVLYGTETRDLIKNIMKGNTEAAGELALLSRVKIPGQDLGSILSPSKLAGDAYAAYAKMLVGNPESKATYEYFKKHGFITDLVEQERSIMNAATLRGTESAGEISKRIGQMTDAVKFIAKPVTGLNQGVEDMNRFVSAYTAKSISDIAVKHGLLTEGEQLSYINTFVNRTNGNFIANQRPMLFQGPIGQAVGLFQTYQFNLMQQLFRYVGEGGNKSAAMLLGLQGTVYGMNGLPGFNAINTHIVGNASGNITHADIISKTYDLAGKEAGNWLLYGTASNALIHPDAKVNLYSRGDINPRQLTIVPTNPADVAIVGATTKLFTSLKTMASRMSAGGDTYSTFLQGIEHAGISRPLSGLAQVAQGLGNPQGMAYSTTSKGTIIGANDLFSLTSMARIAGGRPLDEAIANDAVFRLRAYSAAQHEQINTLGAAIKSKVQSGTMDQETLFNFQSEYMQRGGKQDGFNRFMMRQMSSANVSAANKLADDLKNPISQNMQSMTGGYRLQDLANIN